jgi:hypothetical protein
MAAPGYVSEDIRYLSPTDPTADVERTVQLARGVAITGVVLDGGRPAAGAEVGASGPLDGYYHATADASGAFEIQVPVPGRYQVRAHEPSVFDPPTTDVTVGPDGRSDVAIELAHAPEITGTVVDLAGTPVPGARVYAHGGILWVSPVVADARGHFAIHGASEAYVIAQHDHESSAWRHAVPGSAVQLAIGPAGVAGVVVDGKGVPIANAEVWLNHCCEPGPTLVGGASAFTDGRGRFGIETPRGDFVLSVRRDTDDDYDDADDVRVQGGARDVRLVLP